jgi:hypothetical protein
MMITPQLKDKLLKQLISAEYRHFSVSLNDLCTALGVGADVIDCLIDHFSEMGLCDVERLVGGTFDISLHVEADDLWLRGGFVGREELYQKELLKLEKELEDLCEKCPDKVALFGNALTLIGIVKGFF